MTTLTQERLKELFSYDAETGDFRWLSPKGRAKRGVAGANCNGYLQVCIGGKFHYLHRLAWLWVYGDWPKQHIDHINGDRSDNRIANLRDVSRFVNLQNEHKARRNNQSGLIGAHKKGRKWISKIRVGGEYLLLGNFSTPQEAHEAYIAAKRKYHEGNTL